MALIILNMALPILVQNPYSIEGYQLKPTQVFADEYKIACSINTQATKLETAGGPTNIYGYLDYISSAYPYRLGLSLPHAFSQFSYG